MRQMKDSGVEWIGEIPSSWNTIKLKYLFSIISGNGFPDYLQGRPEGDYPFCKVSDINGLEDYVQSATNWITRSDVEANKYNIIPTSSIIMAKIGAALAKNHRKINAVECCIDNNTQALVPKRNDIIRFLLYLTKCVDMKWFDNNSTVPSVNNSLLLGFFVPNVPLSEQQLIAEYLDRKCAEIDAVIADTQKTIDEYKALKQSIITEAVTKGIRGNRPMKDSGIEWFPVIPKDWSVSRVGLHFDIILGKMLCNNQLSADYTLEPYYCAADVHFSGISTYGIKTMWFSPVEKDQYRVSVGDLLVVEGGAGAGGCAIVNQIDFDAYIQNSVMIVRERIRNTIRYLRYLIESLVCSGYIDIVCNKATIPHFTKDKLARVPFLLSDEAGEIADYLDMKISQIDDLISTKERIIDNLESYKKSLIYECVTGKKEVV